MVAGICTSPATANTANITKKSHQKINDTMEEEKHHTTPMTEQQKRLFQLRLKLNKCRRMNLEEVAEEHQKEEFLEKRKRELDEENERRRKKGQGELLYTVDKLPFFKHKKRKREEESKLDITAETAEYIQKREKRKIKSAEEYKRDPSLHSYHRRVEKLDVDLIEANQEQSRQLTEVKDDFSYGSTSDTIPEKNKQLLAEEIIHTKKRNAEKRSKRVSKPEENIDFINNSNRLFNKKVSQAYEPYTAEIKQNLERGTAL
jgi:pre-mRNA-splicing factor SYF2